jgi:hypothetical protein
MAVFVPGQEVVGANDLSRPQKVGTIVRLVRRDQITGVNEGLIEEKEIYLVRWMVPSAEGEQAVEIEHPAEALRALPSPRRHGGTAEAAE